MPRETWGGVFSFFRARRKGGPPSFSRSLGNLERRLAFAVRALTQISLYMTFRGHFARQERRRGQPGNQKNASIEKEALRGRPFCRLRNWLKELGERNARPEKTERRRRHLSSERGSKYLIRTFSRKKKRALTGENKAGRSPTCPFPRESHPSSRGRNRRPNLQSTHFY